MESEGIKLDVKNLNKYRLELENEIDEIEKRIYNLAAVNLTYLLLNNLEIFYLTNYNYQKNQKKLNQDNFQHQKKYCLSSSQNTQSLMKY